MGAARVGVPFDAEDRAAEEERRFVLAELERLTMALDQVTRKIAARVEVLSQFRR